MAKAGRAAAGAGHRRDRLLRRRHDRHRRCSSWSRRRSSKLAVSLGAPDYFAIMVLAFIAVDVGARLAPRIRGFASLLLGLTIGLVGIDQ